MPRYRMRFGLVDEGCVRRGRPGGPAGVERRRIGYQPPQGGSGSGPATVGKGAAADDVLRWFVVSRDGTGTYGSGFLPLAWNVDRRECRRRPAVDVGSRDVGVQPILRLGEPRGRRKTVAGDGVRVRPNPGCGDRIDLSPKGKSMVDADGVEGRYRVRGAWPALQGVRSAACAVRYTRIPGLVYLTPLSYPIRFRVSISIVGLIQYWNQQLATTSPKQL